MHTFDLEAVATHCYVCGAVAPGTYCPACGEQQPVLPEPDWIADDLAFNFANDTGHVTFCGRNPMPAPNGPVDGGWFAANGFDN